ncbi:protein phosphatase CheZ [Porticoccus sp.]
MTTEHHPAPGQGPASAQELFQRLGQLTRMLRESMRELGLQKEVERAVAEAVPDAKARLSYVASMTEQAAERVLNAVDRAQPMQTEIEAGAEQLQACWDEWLNARGDQEQAGELALQTVRYLGEVKLKTRATGKELLDITMAQDFQDLTGQVIKKLMEVMQSVEDQLLTMLLDSRRAGKNPDAEAPLSAASRPQPAEDTRLLNGPQVDPNARNVVTSQDQVDDLLDELGF